MRIVLKQIQVVQENKLCKRLLYENAHTLKNIPQKHAEGGLRKRNFIQTMALYFKWLLEMREWMKEGRRCVWARMCHVSGNCAYSSISNDSHVQACVYLQPSVVWSRVVIPTQKKMVPMSWLVAHWSKPTHIASARRNGTAMVPLKHVK